MICLFYFVCIDLMFLGWFGGCYLLVPLLVVLLSCLVDCDLVTCVVGL